MDMPLKIVGFGQVLEPNEPGSMYCRIIMTTDMANMDGDVSENQKESMYIEDAHGNKKKIDATRKPGYMCKWLALNSPNRYTPPDMFVNQKVILWKALGVDELFYTPMFNEYDLRETEEITFIVSNKQSKDDQSNGGDLLANSYRFNISSRNKEISLRTNRNGDIEKVAYELVMDMLNGRMFLADDQQNVIYLDSIAGKLVHYLQHNLNLYAGESTYKNITTSDNTRVGEDVILSIGKSKTEVIGDTSIQLVTGNSTILNKSTFEQYVDDAYTLVSSKDAIILSKGTLHIEGKEVHITSGTGKMVIFGTEIDITAPKINLNTPALMVPGVIQCGALSMGGAAPGNVNPPIVTTTTPEEPDLEDWNKTLEEETKKPPIKKDEDSSKEDTDTKQEDKKEDKKEQGDEEDKEPQSPSTHPDNTNAIMSCNQFNVQASEEAGLTTSKTLTLSGKTGTLETTGGVLSIKGNGQDLADALKAISDLADAVNTLVTQIDIFAKAGGTGTGVIVFSGAPALSTAIAQIKTSLQTAKATVDDVTKGFK